MYQSHRSLVWVAVGRRLAGSLFGLFLCLASSAQPSFADTITYRVPGLSSEAEIVVDRWGIPHIYGRTMEDLFFAQGFNAARDRLWQLDLWRRQGEGKLAEAFGPRFVDQDRAARLFLYRGNLETELSSYHPQGKEILTAFTHGINAYIDLTRARPELLPIEFRITGARPGHWSITTPLIRIFGLTRNLNREVNLAQLVNIMGAEAVERVSYFQPPTRLEVPKGLDLSLINSSVIGSYNLARAGVVFQASDFTRKLSKDERVRWAQRLSVPPIGQSDNPFQPMYESNNWTISGRLTATGMPILAGDPHRAQSVPSLRYISHLHGPGWNVIGAGEPALPGISLGHNDRIAYALTIFSFADEEDLYVYDTNPDNPSQYLYQGQWEDMRVVPESIPVRGSDPVAVSLKFTRHGPVLSEDPRNRKSYALRAAYLEHEGTAVYLASLRVDQAQNWEEFVAGMERHYTPSENMVYADVDGNIGWFGCSIAPIRPNWNGMLPVPGNGDYEWQGFLDPRELPRILNPNEGFFASANQYNIPENYPFTSVSGHEWTEPYRFNRILEVLRGGRQFTLGDSVQLQYDEVSLPARDLIPFLNYLSSDDPDVQRALAMLRDWDYVLSKESGAAALYEIWVMQLHENVFARYVPPQVRSLFGQGSRVVLTELLRSPDGAFGNDPSGGRDALVLQSLVEAVDILKTRLGPDMSQWQWGQLHHMTYEHQLAAFVNPEEKVSLNVGPLPMGGDGYTVHNTGFRLSDFNQNTGSSYREVMDPSNWDRSVTINSPGQSGDPNSPHYRDLFPLWAEGSVVPLLYSRDQIMEAAETIFILRPRQRAGSAAGNNP
jgi:penicillin amidase